MDSETPRAITFIRGVMIPMPDGVRLAGNLYIPEEPGEYPGIFTYIPYQKDGRAGLARDAHYRHFASRGYAVMQIDFRGTAISEGVTHPPFGLGEARDGYHIVEWMAAQPWRTGRVGIWGVSYGGCTALGTAALRPPHLAAIVPLHATYDNFAFLCMPHGTQSLLLADFDSGATKAAYNLMPPLHYDRDGRWMRVWRERLEDDRPWILDWHGEPPEPNYWELNRTDYERIAVPTFGICAWRDSYPRPNLHRLQRRPSSQAGLDRPLEARLPGPVDGRAGGRAPRDGPLVESLAQGDRQRGGPGAADRHLRAGRRRVARGDGVAAGSGRDADALRPGRRHPGRPPSLTTSGSTTAATTRRASRCRLSRRAARRCRHRTYNHRPI